jgi:hypothetical protein
VVVLPDTAGSLWQIDSFRRQTERDNMKDLSVPWCDCVKHTYIMVNWEAIVGNLHEGSLDGNESKVEKIFVRGREGYMPTVLFA